MTLRALALAVALIFVATPTLAAKEPKREAPKTKKVEAVSKRVYTMLTKANDALQAEPPNFGVAEKELNAILALPKANSHELALVHQSFGYLYSSKEQYGRSIKSFEKALALEGLPDSAQLNTQFNLGQLYMLEENYDKGISILTNWFDKAQNPPASAYMLMANAYAQKASNMTDSSREKAAYRNAWKWAKQGLDKMDQSKPREAWMRLGSQLNLALENYKTSAHWLEQLARRWPKETYLKQLTAVYGQLEKPRRALVAMEMANMAGYLTESKEFERLGQLYLFNEVPYSAAVLLEEKIASGTVAKTTKNWELLANSWTMAREYDKALKPLERAASAASDGKLYVRLGQLHIDGERWKEAEAAIRKGINKGGVDSVGEAYLLLGITQFQSQNFGAARASFDRAGRDAKVAKSSRAWIQAINARAN